MKIAITGIHGHIGTNLCIQLIEKGHKIKGLTHSDKGFFHHDNLEEIIGSLDNLQSLNELCNGVDVVIHLAAKQSILKKEQIALHQINVEGTRNIIAACKKNGVRRFIHFSSIHALNPIPTDAPMDETRELMLHGTMGYEKTKAISEQLVLNESKNELETIILNPTSIIGPNDHRPSYLGNALIRIYKRQLPGLIPAGYNWVDVRDVVDATINAMTMGRSGERYLLSGNYATLDILAQYTKEYKGGKVSDGVLPIWLAYIGLPFYNFWNMLINRTPLYTRESLEILKMSPKVIISEKAEKELDFKSRPLQETIHDSLVWFKNNGFL